MFASLAARVALLIVFGLVIDAKVSCNESARSFLKRKLKPIAWVLVQSINLLTSMLTLELSWPIISMIIISSRRIHQAN